MRANEFVNKFGWEHAKDVLNGCKSWIDRKSGNVLSDNSFVIDSRTYEHAIGTLYMGEFTKYCEKSYREGEVNLLLLKRLVASHELVESKGGLTKAKEVLVDNPVWCFGSKRYSSPLEKAIADVESCL